MKAAIAKSPADNSPRILNPFITVEYITSLSIYTRISFTMALNKYGPKPQSWQIPFQLHNYPLAQNTAITKIKCYCVILCRVLGCLVCLGVLGCLVCLGVLGCLVCLGVLGCLVCLGVLGCLVCLGVLGCLVCLGVLGCLVCLGVLGCLVCLGVLGPSTSLLHSHVVRMFGVFHVFEW